MKKLSAIILATLMLFVQLPTAAATETHNALCFDSVYPEANIILNIAIQQGTVPDLDNGQISGLYMAESIPLYEIAANGTLTEVTDLKYYPVLDQNNIARGLIIASLLGTDTTATIEYNTLFADELSIYKQDNASICFVFDQTDIYVYNGNTCSAVLQNGLPDTTRGVLETDFASFDQLQRALITAKAQFNLIQPSDSSVAGTSGSLDVDPIEQEPWDNGCWAASAICVGEYSCPYSVHRTMDDIMEEYANGNDVPKSFVTVQNVLATEYYLETSVYLRQLKLADIAANIGTGRNNGDPVLARVSYEGLQYGHFIVACGYTATADFSRAYVTIMDSLDSDIRVLPMKKQGTDFVVQYTTPTDTEVYYTDLFLTV